MILRYVLLSSLPFAACVAASAAQFQPSAPLYEACLKQHIITHRQTKIDPLTEVQSAARACQLAAPPEAEDIQLGILECGVLPEDASPDMGCEMADDSFDQSHGQGVRISQQEYGPGWPFPLIEEAILRCKLLHFNGLARPRPIVTLEIGRSIWGLNGAAIGVGGIPLNADDMVATDKNGFKINGDSDHIIKKGINLCGAY